MINLKMKNTSYEENDSRSQKELSSGEGCILDRAIRQSSGDIWPDTWKLWRTESSKDL